MSSPSPIALAVFSACALAACASPTPDEDAPVTSEAALAVPDVRPGTGCLVTHSSASGGDPYLRVEFTRADRAELTAYDRGGRPGATSRGAYSFNEVSVRKRPSDGALELLRGDTNASREVIGVLTRTASGYRLETARSFYPSMPSWSSQRAAATCDFTGPDAFPPLPEHVTFAPPQDVTSSFRFPDDVSSSTCRATAANDAGVRLEITFRPGTHAGGASVDAWATVFGQDAKGYGRDLAKTVPTDRGFGGGSLRLKDVGEIRSTYEGGGTYRLVFEPSLLARNIQGLGRGKVPLRCE